MRIFIALLFEEEKKNIIYDILQEVRVISDKGDFTSLSNLHLTLVYIGNTDQDQLISIRNKLAQIRMHKFTYLTTKIKYFKKSNNQKIVYLGVEKTNALLELFQQVSHKLNEIGYDFPTEKYTPHITLGRKVQFKQYETVSSIYCNQLVLEAKKISIMESKRVDDNLVYEELFSIPLKASS